MHSCALVINSFILYNISGTKGGWGGVGKKRGEPKIFQNPRGNQSLTHYGWSISPSVFVCLFMPQKPILIGL